MERGFVLWTCWALFLGVVVAPMGAESEPAALTVEEVAALYPTPEALACFLKREIDFKPDRQQFGKIDYWQRPEELLVNRAGDCEDFALLAQAVLTHQGKEAFLLSIYGLEGDAHTVCVFVEEGRYSVMNQDLLIRYQASSLEQLAWQVNPSWRWAAVALQAGDRGRRVQEIHNPSPVTRHPSRRTDFSSFPFY